MEQASGAAKGRLPRPLRRFGLTVAVLSVLSLAVEAFAGRVLHLGHPYNSPFVAPQSRFDDLLDWLPQFSTLHTEAFFHTPLRFVYPAPMAALYAVLAHAGRAALACYLLSALAIFGVAGFAFTRSLARRAGAAPWRAGGWVLLLGVTSYPIAFLLYTANLELYLLGVLLLAHWSFRRGRLNAAGACIGLAMAMKLYPAIFLLRLLERRAWRALGVAALVAVAVTLGGLWLEFPGIAHSWQLSRAATAFFFERDALHRLDGQIGYDHSLFALLKAPFPDLTLAAARQMWAVYRAVAAAGAMLLWSGRGRRLPEAEQLTLLTVLMILLPPVSYDYTLVHLYAPFALLALAVAAEPEERPARARAVALGAFAVLFTPQAWLIAGMHSYGGQVKCGALTVLLAAACLSSRQPPPGAGDGARAAAEEATFRVRR